MDKISGLPDELLVKILSFLPTKVAVSTSVLSKRWKFLWMWLPKLDYGYGGHESVRDFIHKNLPLHRALVIESLHLCSLYAKPEDLKLWVEIAASRCVRELKFSYPYYFGRANENAVPTSLFACGSLVILKLRSATLMDVPSMVCFPSLKSLQLDEVTYADEKSLQGLLSICPVLEDLDLELTDLGTMKGFTVNVPSLQKLSLFVPRESVSAGYGYEIDTPSLKYLILNDWNDWEHYSLFKNMPKLREAYIDVKFLDLKSVFGSITSVKHLTLCSQDVYGDGVVFNQLEHLKLCVRLECDSTILLSQLLEDSPNLRVLDISMDDYELDDDDDDDDEQYDIVSWKEPSDVPECLLSSLQIFNWSRYLGRQQDKDIAVYILKNACHLKKATILADIFQTSR